MIHFSKNNPFVFIWNIKFGIVSCKNLISSPTLKTHIFGEEEWNIYYYPKTEDGILDRLVLKRALIDRSAERIAISHKMEIDTELEKMSSGELQGNFNKGGYSTWEFLNNNSLHVLTIKLFIWDFSTEHELSRIIGHTEVEEESASLSWKIDDLSSSVLEHKIVFLPTTSMYKLSFEMSNGGDAKLIFTQIMCTCEGPLYLNIEVFCLDSTGHRNSLVKTQYRFDRLNKSLKISPFIKRCQMLGENGGLLVNDVLMFHIKLTAQTGKTRDSIVEYQYGSQLPDEVIETEEIMIPSKRKSCSTLQGDLLSLYNNRNMTDVTFQIGDKTLHAHKCILGARSPVFSAMFEQQMLENTNNLVDIEDIDYDTFDIMLRFLYDATLPNLIFETAKSLMIASDKYQILSLKEECAEFLKSRINTENVCEILMLSDLLNEEKLKLIVVEFIKPNKKGFLKSAEWKELTKNNRVLATEVLTSLVMDE